MLENHFKCEYFVRMCNPHTNTSHVRKTYVSGVLLKMKKRDRYDEQQFE